VTGFVDVVTSEQRRAGYERAGLWDGVTLAGQVRAHSVAQPQRVAVVDERGSHTWVELAQDVGRAAAGLAVRGVVPGSVVSIQLPNRYEAVVAAVATQALGAVINPLLPNYRVRELSHVFRTVAPTVIFTPADYRGHDHVAMIADVAGITGHAPHHVIVDGNANANANANVDDGGAGTWAHLLELPPLDLTAGDARRVSEVIFTSGTEATPKAVMHTEQTAGFSVRVARDDLGVTDDDVVWMPSPVGHSTGFNYGVRFALHHGLRLVLQDRWDAEDAVALVTREGATYTLAATTFLQDLCGAAARLGADVSSLRYFGCGGAPVPPPLVDLAAEHGIGVLRLYGSTEVLVATWNRAGDDPELRRTTDGRPMSHVEVALRDLEGGAVGGATGGATGGPADGPGEIIVRGPNTCVGFFDDPDRTAATFDDGWVRSGDIARIDDAGHLTMVGRRKEILIRGGLNIAPREIEELIVAFPEVERVAVVGVPDERLGERMAACVTLVQGATLDLRTVVDRLLRAGVARFKLPEQLAVLDALPTTASGKIQKHEIVRTLIDGEIS
jgi:acyl-CoA synthetase (AMP-forming)/AMP-acid ligase II